ncbi:S8 family serine peptidase [Streptomyces sp. NPDC005962]|uniref:S8 family serine peptidase n=1 Tax=Streptomyces sp. NPDC005962 TaxID=3154466 RepID=UPI0033EA2F42
MPIPIRAARSNAQRSLVLLTAALTCWAGTAPAASAEDVRSRQWYLDAMKVDQMQEVATGSGVTVAVVDSGVDRGVPELRGRVLSGKNMMGNSTNTADDTEGHGTRMASLIAGTGASGGIQGVAPDAKILPVKNQAGKIFAADEVMGKSIRFAVDNGAKVINISMGAPGPSEDAPYTRRAVDYAMSKGKLIFASSGNDGDQSNESGYPANIPGVVGVGAVNSSGAVAKLSTFGPQVALAAPGEDIPGRCEGMKALCNTKGTSPAAALASASAALIWSKHPSWTNNQVLRVMMQTANKPKGKVPSRYIGYGIIRPAQVLLDGKGKPGPADVNPLLEREGATTPDPSPSASKSGGTQPQPSDSNNQASDQQAGKETAADAKSSEGGNTGLWVALGAGAAVVVAAVAVVMVRRRGSQY